MTPMLALQRLKRIDPGTMLDIGARDCTIARMFADRGYAVEAIDPDPLRCAAEKASAEPPIRLRTTSLEDFRTDTRYDLVVASLVSQFVRYDIATFLGVLRSLAADDGLIYVTLVGDGDGWASIPRVKAVSETEALARIEEAGLRPLHRGTERYEGPDFDGKVKDWHILSFVLTPS